MQSNDISGESSSDLPNTPPNEGSEFPIDTTSQTDINEEEQQNESSESPSDEPSISLNKSLKEQNQMVLQADMNQEEQEGEQKQRLIHPIIIYPFSQPEEYDDLKALYDFMRIEICSKTKEYSTPITVLNWQTYEKNVDYNMKEYKKDEFLAFIREIEEFSEVINVWCVDTCQMWLSGIGKAFKRGINFKTGSYKEHHEGDVYWLIPGDFNYASKVVGKKVLAKIEEIPQAVRDHRQDFCIGEIEGKPNSSKQLIDTYGTYGLLYNWFPYEAQEIRKKTDKPRSEFWAISHSFLEEILRQRWYAYEQTIVILLHAVIRRKLIHKVELGNISDLPQGRDSLAAAMQQVERTERVLKLFWRENAENRNTQWTENFRKLDAQSEQIRGAALVILQNLLG